MTTPNKAHSAPSAHELEEFLEGVCESDPFKVERDFGHGYVKLRSTEAEKRQAAQDIKCFEDIVIELLRNSRDAGAKNIYLATATEDGSRTLTVIDDGQGIPHELWKRVFEPRVTSKLETAHMDKWGMHGRGMALYSTKVNTTVAEVVASEPDLGCAIHIQAPASLPEKADQSTFPRFEEVGGIMAMRGPKNILRTCCEFVLEHRQDATVYVGTPAQIASTLYHYGLATVPAYARAFAGDEPLALTKALGLANSPEDLVRRAASLGLSISLRTARRIMDGQSESIDDLATMMAAVSFAQRGHQAQIRTSPSSKKHLASRPRISSSEQDAFLRQVMTAYGEIADAYYLDDAVTPTMRVAADKIVLEIPLAPLDDDEGSPSAL